MGCANISRVKAAPTAPRAEPPEVLYGLRAGLAVLTRRPDDLVRVAYAPSVRAELAPLLQLASARKLPCDELTDAELARIARTDNHEGLCLAVRPRRWLSPGELGDALTKSRGAALALDRVRNPYNIGAILRSAAFFGLDGALLGAPAPHPALAPDAVRVAEGGAEHLLLARTTDLGDTLCRLRARGVRVVGAENDAAHDARGYDFARPTVLVLGHEREGLSDRVKAQCDAMVAIRGAGKVGSLNVAVAASVLIAELTRAAR